MNQLWQMLTMYQIWLISFDFKRYIKWLTMILDVWKWTLFFILVLCNLQTENYCKVGIYCWYCNALQNDWNKYRYKISHKMNVIMVEELFIPIHYLTKIHIISCIFVINFGCFNLFGNHQKKQEELEKVYNFETSWFGKWVQIIFLWVFLTAIFVILILLQFTAQ